MGFYYPIPIDFEDVLSKDVLYKSVDLRESIHQNIDLLLRSYSQSYAFDLSFGSLMNKYYAATPPQRKKVRVWRETMRSKIQANIEDMLVRYETRIKINQVVVQLSSEKKQGDSVVMGIEVQVYGNLSIGRKEKFHYPDTEVLEEAKGTFPLMIPIGKMN